LIASGGGRTQTDGTFINSAILSWDAVDNFFLSYYEVEWKVLSDSNYSSTTTTENTIELSPLIDGIEYIFRVRAVTVGGVKGDYSTVQFTGGGDTTAPALPTNAKATGGFRYITVEWTNPADADLNYVEVWENASNTTSGATRVGISGGNEFVRTNLGISEQKYYFLRSVDYSGNISAFTTSANWQSGNNSATSTFVDDDDFENGVRELFIEQGLDVIAPVLSLPPSGDFIGQQVFLRSDGKLYNWNGSSWVGTVADVGDIDFSQLTGTIGAAQIVGQVVAADNIVANSITTGQLAASGVITSAAQIDDAVIENAKIANLAVDTIKVANDAITRHDYINYSNVSASTQTYNFPVSMPFAGDITVIAHLVVFGTGSTGTLDFSVTSSPYGITTGYNISSPNGDMLGDHTALNSVEVFPGFEGTYNFQTVVTVTGVTNPVLQLTLISFKRFK
jgi:hypothetical protein